MASSYKEIILIIIIGSLLLVALASIIILAALQYKRKQKANEQEKLLLANKFQQELLHTQLEIQEQTLNNISQEIHDNIGQALSLVKLNLNTLSSPQQQKLEDARELIAKAISDLRDLSRSLHGEKIAEIGLQVAIANELKILQNSGRFHTQLSISGKPFSLPGQTEIILFRIVQEALHNALKHTQAKAITVNLGFSDDALLLTIADNGSGFNQEQLQAIETGIGLKNMKNRAALIQAEFSINSVSGKGTVVAVNLPFTGLLPAT